MIRLLPFSLDTIPVDLDHPEDNMTGGKVMWLKAKNLKGVEGGKFEGRFYDGAFILVEVDQRWFKTDKNTEHYTCTVYNKDELLLKVPSTDFDFLNDRDEVEKLVSRNKAPEELLDAIDHAHDQMLIKAKNESWKYVYLRLKFKSPVELAGEVLHKGIEDTQQLPPERLKFSSGRNFFYWKVARVDTESYKKGKAEKKGGKSQGASLFDSPEKMNEGT